MKSSMENRMRRDCRRRNAPRLKEGRRRREDRETAQVRQAHRARTYDPTGVTPIHFRNRDYLLSIVPSCSACRAKRFRLTGW